MDAHKLHEFIDKMQGKRALVLGDIMLDEYIWGAVDRISPEAPVPVVNVRKETRTVGGAGNVALNVKMLGMKAVLSGIVGEDYHGGVITRILKEKGIDSSGICRMKDSKTVVKTRIIAHSQQMVRIDRENSFHITDAVRNDLVRKIREIVPAVDFVIVSDYNKGTVDEGVYRALVMISKESGKSIIVDPKKKNVGFYRGCSVIKPNQKEAELFSGIDIQSEDDIVKAGRKIMGKTAASAVLISRGEQGMTLIRRRKKDPFNIPAIAKEVYDVTGAGDTVISTFSAVLSAGGGYEVSALLSNIAAAVVVGEVGTSPITRDKLIRAVKRYQTDGFG